MDWSPKQDAALLAVGEWLANPNRQPLFRLFGYAGTGKTTLARHFAEGCGGLVLFAAFTGKAASVMRANGCVSADTIHRLIYKPQPKSEVRMLELNGRIAELETELRNAMPDEERELKSEQLQEAKAEKKALSEDLKKPSFVLNFDSLVKEAKLLIVDECSMVNEEMGRDLLSFGTPILVLGDPAQLPPVGGAGYFTKDQPDVMLTEIHRQAQDSPIIRLATAIRKGDEIPTGKHGESLVVHRRDLDPESVMAHDQMLVGRNATRKSYNARVRERLGRSSHLPEPPDKLVCLRNDHKVGLLNGEIWITEEGTIVDNDEMALLIRNEENGTVLACDAHRHPFEGRELEYFERLRAQEFDYGYALTCHKAQGSQWPSVILFDESGCFRKDRKRWLYTAVTRAADRVTVVQGM